MENSYAKGRYTLPVRTGVFFAPLRTV